MTFLIYQLAAISNTCVAEVVSVAGKTIMLRIRQVQEIEGMTYL